MKKTTKKVKKRAVNREALAVARGVKWLDKNHPGWALKINLKTLVLCSCRFCVLGQCFGDFWSALNQFAPNVTTDSARDRWAARYGFQSIRNRNGEPINGTYERLGLAWAPYIAIRQVKAAGQ